jgi:hypothetical protein
MNTDSISFNDLVTVAQIINLAATRGAFRGEELSEVGAVYDRIVACINTLQQQQTAVDPPSGD